MKAAGCCCLRPEGASCQRRTRRIRDARRRELRVDANGQDIYQQPAVLYLCVTLNSLGTRHVTSANENRQFSSVIFPENPSFLYAIVTVLNRTNKLL